MIRTILKYLAVLLIFCVIAGLSAFFTLSFVIKSEDTVVVPELEDKDAIAALEMLSDLGLNTKVEGSEYSDEVARNHILYQDPAGGQEIKKNRDVTVVISKGPQTVAIPDLKGRQLARAEIILEENGLAPGNISATHSRKVAENRIIAQYPAAGKAVDRQTAVNLLISTGRRPKSFKMPDMTGLFMDQAMLAVEKLQLQIEDVKSIHDPSKPQNMVTSQAPPSGYRVVEGGKVRLIVNRRPGTSGRDKMADRVLFSYRVPPGFLKQHIRLELNCSGTLLTIYDGLMKPDTPVWAIIPEQVQASVFLYRNDKLVKTEIFD